MIIYNEELGTRGGFDTMKWVFLLNKNDFEDTNQYQKLNEYCCIRKSKHFEVKKYLMCIHICIIIMIIQIK